jgi:hypothetical protein
VLSVLVAWMTAASWSAIDALHDGTRVLHDLLVFTGT